MSALRPMISRSVAQATRYQMRTKATTALPTTRQQFRFEKERLSGSATNPISMVLVVGGLTFVVGSKAWFWSNDVEMNPSSYGSTLAESGQEQITGFLERFFKSEEEEQVKQKAAYSKQMAEYYSNI